MLFNNPATMPINKAILDILVLNGEELNALIINKDSIEAIITTILLSSEIKLLATFVSENKTATTPMI